MKKSVYYISIFSVIVAVLILFAAVLTYNTNAAPAPSSKTVAGSEQVARFNDAIKAGKPVMVGFYSPT